MWLAIVTSIISSIVSSILHTGFEAELTKLKEGDIADDKRRKQINEGLENIEKKIDGLSRKDILASYCFLKEGIVSLNLAIHEEANGARNDGSNATTATTTTNESQSGVINEAIQLSDAIQRLQNTSNGGFARAIGCFSDARKEATRAFCNEALSLSDRIMAAQLRIFSKILECLQDTKAAAASCMLFLRELHNLPAVGEAFSLYFRGGIGSIFFKDARLENVKSVLALNFAVSEFVARFSGELPNVRNWPTVHLFIRGEMIHPLLLHIDVLREVFDKEELQLPENQVTSKKIHSYCCFCVNSKGQLLASPSKFDQCVNVFDRSGIVKTFCDLEKATANHLNDWWRTVHGLIIDRYDNVSVVARLTDSRNQLVVFDSSGEKQNVCFVDDIFNDIFMSCVVNNDGDILMYGCGDNRIYACGKFDTNGNANGNIKSILSLERNFIRLECVTNQNEIVMRTEKCVFVLTKEGKTKRTIDVENVIEAVAFNYATSKIEILVMNEESMFSKPSYSILSYSENCDEIECLCLPVKRFAPVKFCSHSAGPAVLVYQDQDWQGHAIFM